MKPPLEVEYIPPPPKGLKAPTSPKLARRPKARPARAPKARGRLTLLEASLETGAPGVVIGTLLGIAIRAVLDGALEQRPKKRRRR